MFRQSISCNIAIIPPAPIARKAIAMSRRLKKGGGLFVLDGEKYFSHVTLYMTEFPRKNIRTIKALLRNIAAHTRAPTFSSRTIEQKKDQSVIIVLKSTPAHTLHKKIIRLFNHLREGLIRPKDVARFNQLTKQEQRMLRRYGFKDALARYVPHITLTKLSEARAALPQQWSSRRMSFRANSIGLFQSGEHGTCRKLLVKFPLKG